MNIAHATGSETMDDKSLSFSAAQASCSWDACGTSSIQDILVASVDQGKLGPPDAAPCVLLCQGLAKPLDITLQCPQRAIASVAVRSSCKHIELYTASDSYIKTLVGRQVGELEYKKDCQVPIFAAAWSGRCLDGCKVRLVASAKKAGHQQQPQVVQGILVHAPAQRRSGDPAGSTREPRGRSAQPAATAAAGPVHSTAPMLAAVMSQLARMDSKMSTLQASVDRLQASVDQLQARVALTAPGAAAAGPG